jgi:hypothetical protein
MRVENVTVARMSAQVDLGSLSEQTQETLRTIGRAIEAGYAVRDIATGLGVSRHVVRHRLDRAKAEIERQRHGGRDCAVCGEPIPWTARSHRITCSPRCRVKRHRERSGR